MDVLVIILWTEQHNLFMNVNCGFTDTQYHLIHVPLTLYHTDCEHLMIIYGHEMVVSRVCGRKLIDGGNNGKLFQPYICVVCTRFNFFWFAQKEKKHSVLSIKNKYIALINVTKNYNKCIHCNPILERIL